MSGGTVGPVDEAQLDALVGRYEWFTPARILRVLQTGRSDRRVSIAVLSYILLGALFCKLSTSDLFGKCDEGSFETFEGDFLNSLGSILEGK